MIPSQVLDWPKGVRAAVPKDAPAILDLLRAMHDETGLAPFHEPSVRRMIWRGVTQQEAVVGVIFGKPDRAGLVPLEGSIGLFVDPFWYSETKRVYDLWNFVPEAYRRSTHAKRLLEFAKCVTTSVKRPLVMSMIENDRTAQKVKLYERQLPKSGAIFVFSAPGVEYSDATT